MDQLFINNAQSTVISNRILYTPSFFAKTSLLHLQEIGELTAQIPHTSSRSNLQSYLFFAVVEGAGNLHYDRKAYQLHAGDMVFIDCTFPYSHTTDGKNLWTLRWVHFYGPQMGNIYEKYKERGGRPVFTPEDSSPFFSVWDALMKVSSSTNYMRDMQINQHLSALLTLVMSESWHPEDQNDFPPKKSIVISLIEYLNQHYREKITLDGLAERFFINKYYLTKTFKEQFGLSINTYLLDLRITRAKKLLRFSEKSVEEIGMECGLGAAHYFSRTFKSVEGVSPSKYREQWRTLKEEGCASKTQRKEHLD